MELINGLCCTTIEHGVSDLFLLAGELPQLRLHGEIIPYGDTIVTAQELESFWTHCGGGKDVLDFDGSFISSNGNRFRVNLFRSLHKRGAVLRPIKTIIPGIETLGVPVDLLISWASRPSGLVLVTGATGSGKSTTIASCLNWVNQSYSRHIVTIEDPIEFLFKPDKCLITQRDVGVDTTSFAEGLRRSLRQSPDVIMLGEIRDPLTAMTALQASETGHLVFATLHSSNVLDSMERLTRLFTGSEREGVLQVISQQLVGILCQKLVPANEGGRLLVLEHFENQAATRKWIMEGKFREMADFIAKGDNPTNVTFIQSLVGLVQTQRISEEVALDASTNPHEVKRQLRGINANSSAGMR